MKKSRLEPGEKCCWWTRCRAGSSPTTRYETYAALPFYGEWLDGNLISLGATCPFSTEL